MQLFNPDAAAAAAASPDRVVTLQGLKAAAKAQAWHYSAQGTLQEVRGSPERVRRGSEGGLAG
eukprot:4103494-Pyramimonas_sp.AAC.1